MPLQVPSLRGIKEIDCAPHALAVLTRCFIERDVSFEHAKKRTIITIPLENGSIYTFGKDVNIEWRHGIPQVKPEHKHNNGRISIIIWGKVNMDDKL